MDALSAIAVVVTSVGVSGCVVAAQTHYPDYRPPLIVQPYCSPVYYPAAPVVYYPPYYPHHHGHHHRQDWD